MTNLYKIARTVRTVNALASGDPKRIGRRARNVAIGRLLARTVYPKLYGKW